MGGGGSTNERAEKEKREAASAKRREIKEKDVKERLALMRGYVSDFFRRAEEEKKREAAKRRELREKELKEHIALMEEDFCDFILRKHLDVFIHRRKYVLIHEPEPNIPRAEEKREAAKRPELEEKELKEHNALMPVYVLSAGPYTIHREDFWPYEPGPHLLLRTEKEREAAKRRELMGKELKEHNALMREDFWPYEPDPNSLREDFWNIIRRSKSCPEKMRAASPASSCGSMRNARSMDFPFSFKRDEEEKREDPSAKRPEIRKLKLEEDRVVLIRECLSPFEPRPNIPLRQDFWPHDRGPNISSHVLRRKEQFLLHRAMVHDE